VKRNCAFLAAIALLIVSGHVLRAQDDVVILSPFEVQTDDMGYQATEMLAGTRIRTMDPAVTLRKRADFITLHLQLVNDARLSELRLAEIRKTVHMILADAKKKDGITLQYSRGTISEENFHVNPVDDGDDTSTFDVHLALPLGADDKADKLTEDLIAFAESLKVDGRTLIEVGKPGLSVKNPERFRSELLAAISSDLAKVRAVFGPDTAFNLGGIDGRMTVKAVSVDELELSLPYSFNVSSEGFDDE